MKKHNGHIKNKKLAKIILPIVILFFAIISCFSNGFKNSTLKSHDFRSYNEMLSFFLDNDTFMLPDLSNYELKNPSYRVTYNQNNKSDIDFYIIASDSITFKSDYTISNFSLSAKQHEYMDSGILNNSLDINAIINNIEVENNGADRSDDIQYYEDYGIDLENYVYRFNYSFDYRACRYTIVANFVKHKNDSSETFEKSIENLSEEFNKFITLIVE